MKALDADLAMAGIPDCDLWECQSDQHQPLGSEWPGISRRTSRKLPNNIGHPEYPGIGKPRGMGGYCFRVAIGNRWTSNQRRLRHSATWNSGSRPECQGTLSTCTFIVWTIHVHRSAIGQVNQAKVRQHRESVRQALAEKPVPPEV